MIGRQRVGAQKTRDVEESLSPHGAAYQGHGICTNGAVSFRCAKNQIPIESRLPSAKASRNFDTGRSSLGYETIAPQGPRTMQHLFSNSPPSHAVSNSHPYRFTLHGECSHALLIHLHIIRMTFTDTTLSHYLRTVWAFMSASLRKITIRIVFFHCVCDEPAL